jgi:hypothetical protein
MGRVKVVFDTVIRSSGEFFCDVSPLVAQLLVQVKDHSFFLLVNWILLDIRIKVVVPAK